MNTETQGLSQAKKLKLVGVRYIGRKPRKNDNVTGSDHVWNGFGDVQQVPEAIALRLCVPRYKDIWQFETEEAPIELSDAARSAKALEQANAALKAHQDALARRRPPEREKAYDTVEPERIIAAIAAVAQKGEKEPDKFFTPEGAPKLEAVQEELGKRISPLALTHAWDTVLASGGR